MTRIGRHATDSSAQHYKYTVDTVYVTIISKRTSFDLQLLQEAGHLHIAHTLRVQTNAISFYTYDT